MSFAMPVAPRPTPASTPLPTATVLCIHAFGGSAAQYQGLVQRLEPGLRVRPGELYGHGRRAPWLAARRFTLADEAAAMQALLPDDGPVHLVAHSYGAAVALRIAATLRRRVRSMALYEPAIWGTLAAWCPGDAATLEIEAVRDDTNALLAAGDLAGATERFIDYWGGTGQWASMPEARKPRVMATVQSLPAVWSATFDERWTAGQLCTLEMPCLLMSGTRSTTAARRATGVLRATLPNARALDFDGLGHLGPITHARAVDAAVEAFVTEAWRSR